MSFTFVVFRQLQVEQRLHALGRAVRRLLHAVYRDRGTAAQRRLQLGQHLSKRRVRVGLSSRFSECLFLFPTKMTEML